MFKLISRAISYRLTRGTIVVTLPYMSDDEFLTLLRPVRRKYIYTKLIDGTYEITFYQSEFIAACFQRLYAPDAFE